MRQSKNPMYDKDLKVSKDIDATSMLIPDCEFVLSIAGSTSISYAIANKKPVPTTTKILFFLFFIVFYQ